MSRPDPPPTLPGAPANARDPVRAREVHQSDPLFDHWQALSHAASTRGRLDRTGMWAEFWLRCEQTDQAKVWYLPALAFRIDADCPTPHGWLDRLAQLGPWRTPILGCAFRNLRMGDVVMLVEHVQALNAWFIVEQPGVTPEPPYYTLPLKVGTPIDPRFIEARLRDRPGWMLSD